MKRFYGLKEELGWIMDEVKNYLDQESNFDDGFLKIRLKFDEWLSLDYFYLVRKADYYNFESLIGSKVAD